MIEIGQFLEVLIGGLLSGVLYSLVAVGFVVIFKASGVFNFAQGAMVLLAGLALVRALEFFTSHGLPYWSAVVLSVIFSITVMTLLAWVVTRFVLGPLINQDGLTLFMSTIGLTFIIEGSSQMIFGSDVHPLAFYPTDTWLLFEEWFSGGILISKLDVWGGLAATILVIALATFFKRTKIGQALRAVADDNLAAESVGVPIAWVWFVVWIISGTVALAAATVWGSRLGVQYSITFLALKALPVLIIGGFTSMQGAIAGGLVAGAGEKLAEVYLGPYIGGGIEYWFVYVLALVILLIRPQGLLGDRTVARI